MFADFDIAGGCGLAREYSAEVRGQGTILPRLALPPLCGRAQRSARSPEVTSLLNGWLVYTPEPSPISIRMSVS